MGLLSLFIRYQFPYFIRSLNLCVSGRGMSSQITQVLCFHSAQADSIHCTVPQPHEPDGEGLFSLVIENFKRIL